MPHRVAREHTRLEPERPPSLAASDLVWPGTTPAISELGVSGVLAMAGEQGASRSLRATVCTL